MTPLDFSSDAALVATVLLTVNILLGLFLSARYNTVQSWPHRRLPIFDIHNWTGYLALVVIFLHGLPLLFVDGKQKFRVVDVLFPIHSPYQTLYNNFGAAAFYLILLVVVTSYLRGKLGSKNWKKIHYASYAAAALLFTHGILTDPELKGNAPDLLDGEKLLIELCAAIIIAATIWRIRYQPRKKAVGPTVRKLDYQS